MPRTTGMALALGLVLTAAALHAEDAYPIKIKEPAKGTVLQIDKRETSQGETKLVDPANKFLVNDKGDTAKTFVYQETILERPDLKKRPTQLKRVYEKAQFKTGDKTEDLPYQGKTVLIDKDGDRYQFRLEGGEPLKGKDARFLEEEFNGSPEDEMDLERAFLPTRPVATQESWDLDMKPILKAFAGSSGIQADPVKSSGTGKLLKVYDKNGAQYGVMAIHLDAALVGLEGKEKVTFGPGARMTADLTFDLCIDGTSPNGTLKGESQFMGKGVCKLSNGQEAQLTLKVHGTTQETSVEVKK